MRRHAPSMEHRATFAPRRRNYKVVTQLSDSWTAKDAWLGLTLGHEQQTRVE